MASLTLKNVPERLLRELRKSAERDRRSLNQEIIHLLEGSLREPRRSANVQAEVDAQVAAWRKLAGKWQSDVDAATEARRIKRRRSSGRKVDL